VVDQEGVVHYHSGEDWIRQRSQTYAFEHMLTHQAFYDQMGPAEKVRYHQDIADILKSLLKDRRNQTRKLLIELARHYDLGQMPFEAARYYYHTARAVFGSGAYGETIKIGLKSLNNIRKLNPGTMAYDRLRVKIILLLLRASEMRWIGKPELQGELPLDELLAEAEKAARRTKDIALLTQVFFLKGLTYVSTKPLPEALRVLNEALQHARSAKDFVLEFSILSFLGHQTVAEDLDTGIELQYQALEIYQKRIEGTTKDNKRRGLRRAHYSLHGYIGVAEFDRGNYDVAEQELNRCIEGLRQLRLKEHLVAPLNFISQLYIAMGQFEKAEHLLKESIETFQKDPEDNPWRAYNRALLGKLYLERQQVDAAVEPIIDGWKETQATRNTWLVDLVRNYYAELLIHPEYSARDLDTAEQLLLKTIADTAVSGFHRSGIWAQSQMGQLELQKQNIERAINHSLGAVDYLKKVGTMPALRAEEIYFNHFRILKAAGEDDQADRYCRKAHEILRQKEGSINNPIYKQSFLSDVPLNRAIVNAFESL
jgi:tetratricopeptide (TPR) repeat protein